MAMADAAVPDIEKGTWVQVWAVVVGGQTHPEDFILRFESHNEDFKAHIKRGHVTVPTEQPSWVPRCMAVHQMHGVIASDEEDEPSEYFLRCQRNLDHDEKHRHVNLTWGDTAATGNAGYLEEA